VPTGRSLPTVALVILGSAVLWDLALRSRAAGTAAFAAIVLSCVGLARAGWVRRRGGRVLLGAAVVVAAFLPVRSSPWLVLTDLAVVAVLISLACTSEAGARGLHGHFSVAARRLGEAVGTVLAGLPALGGAVGSLAPTRSGTGRWVGAVTRGLLLALPVVAVLGVMLATADAVFASWMDVDLDAGGVVGHLVVLGGAAWLLAGWFLLATRPPVRHRSEGLRIGAVEALVVLVGLTGLYALFAAAQVLVLQRGPEYVQQTTGLTYAEYARSGFFQLIWAAAATLVVLLVLRSCTRPGGVRLDRALRVTGALACGSTLVLVHTALVRLGLYEDRFGATLLRFTASAVAWWLGVVVVVVAVAFVLGRSRREWLPPVLGIVCLVGVLTLNAVDPERRVAAHNIDRAADGAALDVAYLDRLSADAVPTLVAGLDRLRDTDARRLERSLCARREPRTRFDRPTDERSVNPVPWNLAERRAADALAARCG
jgi:hypothetical protein